MVYFGLGLGNSIQKYDYIPEAHNDFIEVVLFMKNLVFLGWLLMIIPTAIIIFLDY